MKFEVIRWLVNGKYVSGSEEKEFFKNGYIDFKIDIECFEGLHWLLGNTLSIGGTCVLRKFSSIMSFDAGLQFKKNQKRSKLL